MTHVSRARVGAHRSPARPFTIWGLVAALAFQGVMALIGGVAFLLDTSGDLFAMDTTTLASTPFDTYLVPGLMLLIPLGIVPLFVAWLVLRQPTYGWASGIEHATEHAAGWIGSIIVAVGVMVFIVIEYFYIDYFWLQGLMFGVAVAILTFAVAPATSRHLRSATAQE